MWHETNVFGIYTSPLVVYLLIALLIYAILRQILLRLGVFRWCWNPPLAELAIYFCILGVLVTCF